MKTKLVILALIAVAVGASIPFWGSESSPPPLYGKVLFGLDTSNETAIANFIVQGDEIFIDANNDDLPDPSELVDAGALPKFETGGSIFNLLELKLGVLPELVGELPQQLAMTVEVAGNPSYQQAGSVVMAEEPSNSNWLHVGGPISLVFSDPELVFFKGETGAEIRIQAGAIAQGLASEIGQTADTSRHPVSLVSDNGKPNNNRMASLLPIPGSAVPRLKLEYHNNGDPVIQNLVLDDFC